MADSSDPPGIVVPFTAPPRAIRRGGARARSLGDTVPREARPERQRARRSLFLLLSQTRTSRATNTTPRQHCARPWRRRKPGDARALRLERDLLSSFWRESVRPLRAATATGESSKATRTRAPRASAPASRARDSGRPRRLLARASAAQGLALARVALVVSSLLARSRVPPRSSLAFVLLALSPLFFPSPWRPMRPRSFAA